jgi:hypothetical protein
MVYTSEEELLKVMIGFYAIVVLKGIVTSESHLYILSNTYLIILVCTK